MTIATTQKLTNPWPGKGWPAKATIEELRLLAPKILGLRFIKIVVRTYGGGTQVEVLKIKYGYHGPEAIREAVYRPILEN